MANFSFEEAYGPSTSVAPAPAPAPKKVVVQPVPMSLPAASAPAPNPNAALAAAMQTRNATAAAAPAAPAMPAIPPPPKIQPGEAPVNYKRRLSEHYQRVDQMKMDAVKEAEKAAREAAAPKVGDLSAFSAKEQKLKDFEGYLTDYKNELAKDLTVFPTKIPLIPSQGIEIPLPVGPDTARMQAKYNSLLMGVKDAYQLGALTGPDMSIVEAQITNPASMSGMLYSKDAFNEQVKVLEGLLSRAKTNLETSYGRKMAPQPAAPAQGADPLLLRKK
jgi:hypothetical protein